MDSSTAFVQSRSFVAALGGDQPILVTPDGSAATVALEDIPLKAGDAIHPGA
ncbi:hypothetical protein [Microlunatus parietis]|uniref:Uncharacterized protein n=1 Tax=Microlunatus parietis TaxID=682979 RepID=A0A7Y9L9Q0_9ACTN|nr:hypothetical protein [Microlunatus parietis]NYE69028.1 hypothetical protein [Microlunatus parietis]